MEKIEKGKTIIVAQDDFNEKFILSNNAKLNIEHMSIRDKGWLYNTRINKLFGPMPILVLTKQEYFGPYDGKTKLDINKIKNLQK